VVHEGETEQLTKRSIADINIIDRSVEKFGEPAAKATSAQGWFWASKGWLKPRQDEDVAGIDFVSSDYPATG